LKLLELNFVYVLSGNRSRQDGTKKDRREIMNRTELEKYKAILLAKQAELSGGLRNRDEILIEKTPDALDEVQLAGERELAIRNLDREASLLRNVRAALSRIKEGSYGVCMHCEEDIKPKRLEAVPWAAFCIHCQEAVDRHDFAAAETIDELLRAA
jgi:DnaK suppressor protein